MIEHYEKEMRKMFQNFPQTEQAVPVAVRVEDEPAMPEFRQLEQSGTEVLEMPPQEEPLPKPKEPETETKTKEGSIIVEVTTGKGAVPLSGVTVVIDRLDLKDPKNRKELVAVRTTDRDGRTSPVEVQTVEKDLSLVPGNADPFTTFYISAQTKGFEPVKNRPTDVFANEISILKIDLVPKPEEFAGGETF